MPESTGLEVMEDLSDVWDWVYNKLQLHIGSEIEVDLTKIMSEGDSGGLFTLLYKYEHLGLMLFPRRIPCSSICSYPGKKGFSNVGSISTH